MTPLAYQPEPSARAWHEFSRRAQPTNVSEMQAAMRRASKDGIDYLDALAKVREENNTWSNQ